MKEEEEMYPSNITVEECRQAVIGRREFRETIKDDLLIFNYDFCYGETFPDPAGVEDAAQRRLLKIRRECRGLIFEKSTGKLLARRLHKFFNILQNGETSESRIDFGQPFIITEKIDGALVTPIRIAPNKYILASKNGPTKFSQTIEDEYLSTNKHFFRFFAEWLERDFTLIFEWISDKAPIVLEYEQSALILIAIRHNISGVYVDYNVMKKSAAEFGIMCVKEVEIDQSDGIKSAADFLERVRHQKGIEGCVLRFKDRNMYKVKTDWYFAQSKSMLKLPTNEREMWGSVLRQTIDDILPKLSVEVRRRVETFSAQVFDALSEAASTVYAQCEIFRKECRAELAAKQDLITTPLSKKDYVHYVKRNIHKKKLLAIYLRMYGCQSTNDAIPKVVDYMKRNCVAKNFETIRALLGVQHVQFYKIEQQSS